MRKNAKAVLEAFAAGRSANEKTISCNERELFSYAMKIAERRSDGKIAVIDYAASPSRTTTNQIHAALVFFSNNAVIRVSEF